MIKATSFYSNMFDKFKTGLPKGVLNVYMAGTTNYADTFKDSSGNIPNSKPIILDEKGECSLFFSQDITVDYIIEDSKGVVQYEFKNIRQLMGKDGGEPAPFNPTPEQLEKFRGRQGFQGPSTIGPDGKDGLQGEKGYPFFEKVSLINNQEFTVPEGVPEIFITASGAGGAGASWSPFFYLYDKLSTNQGPANSAPVYLSYKLTEDGNTLQSKNFTTQPTKDFVALTLGPASGFSGQSAFRYKVSFKDTTVEHVVKVFIGVGGKWSSSTLNGGAGTSTKIYVDDKLELELKGGAGGEQQLPMRGASNVPDIPVNGYLRLNKGYNSNAFYVKLTNPDFPSYSYITDTTGNSEFFKTQYRRKLNEIFEYKDLWLASYYKQVLASSLMPKSCIPLSENKSSKGEANIFRREYSAYASTIDSISIRSFGAGIKTIRSGGRGAGAGGDFAFQFNGLNNRNYKPTIDIFSNVVNQGASTSYSFLIFNKSELKAMQKRLMSNFETNDNQTYIPGVEEMPADDSTYWSSLDLMNTHLNSIVNQNPGSYMIYSNPGFYQTNMVKIVQSDDLSISHGDNGQDGYCFIEYGSITQHTAQESIK